jgi:hypothetical protein
MSEMAKKRQRYLKWPAWQKESRWIWQKWKTPLASNMNMNIHQTTNKNSLIFAVGSLTVKHMIVDIAITKIPVAAKRLFVCAVVFLRRDTVTPPRLQSASGAWPRLRGQCD